MTLLSLPSNRAAGLDGVYNEHLRTALFLAPRWAALFNACLESGTIPARWLDAGLLVIPKGKGDPTLPSSWRGIVKKIVCYKLLSCILSRRLSGFLEAQNIIRPQQHGFRRDHSTSTAYRVLLGNVRKTLLKKLKTAPRTSWTTSSSRNERTQKIRRCPYLPGVPFLPWRC